VRIRDALPHGNADELADSMRVADCDRDSHADGHSYSYAHSNPDADSHAICHLRGSDRVGRAERSFLQRTGLSRTAVLACTVGGPVTAD